MSFEVPDFTVSQQQQQQQQQQTEDADILGLDSFTTSSSASTLPSALDPTQQKKKIRSNKITLDVFKSKRGLPALFKQLSRYKFQHRSSKMNSSSSSYNKSILGSEHHFNNLSRILEIYQAWGHSLNPQMKFDAMIQNINSSLNESESKRYLEGVILNERQRKRDKLEQKNGTQEPEQQQQQQQQQQEDDDDEIPHEILQEGANRDWEEEEEMWPEMFSGATSTQQPRVQFALPEPELEPEPQNAESGLSPKANDDNEDQFSDDEMFDASQVRQMVSFSTILDTSSQMPTETQSQVNVGEFAGAGEGFGNFLSDDDNNDNEEEEEEEEEEEDIIKKRAIPRPNAISDDEDDDDLNFL